jgi:hypothetical protein
LLARCRAFALDLRLISSVSCRAAQTAAFQSMTLVMQPIVAPYLSLYSQGGTRESPSLSPIVHPSQFLLSFRFSHLAFTAGLLCLLCLRCVPRGVACCCGLLLAFASMSLRSHHR